jgi:hypothetical protein
MIVIDIPRAFERPRCLVLAFMAGLSQAAGRSARCYVDELVLMLRAGAEMTDE